MRFQRLKIEDNTKCCNVTIVFYLLLSPSIFIYLPITNC